LKVVLLSLALIFMLALLMLIVGYILYKASRLLIVVLRRFGLVIAPQLIVLEVVML